MTVSSQVGTAWHTGHDVGSGPYVLCNTTTTVKRVVFDSSSPLKLCSSPWSHHPCCQTFLQDFLNSRYLDFPLQTEPEARDKMLYDISFTKPSEPQKEHIDIKYYPPVNPAHLPWEQCQAPESQSCTLSQDSCAFKTQDFVLFTHISLQTRSDECELISINDTNTINNYI